MGIKRGWRPYRADRCPEVGSECQANDLDGEPYIRNNVSKIPQKYQETSTIPHGLSTQKTDGTAMRTSNLKISYVISLYSSIKQLSCKEIIPGTNYLYQGSSISHI
jgi:hypothetical protein